MNRKKKLDIKNLAQRATVKLKPREAAGHLDTRADYQLYASGDATLMSLPLCSFIPLVNLWKYWIKSFTQKRLITSALFHGSDVCLFGPLFKQRGAEYHHQHSALKISQTN